VIGALAGRAHLAALLPALEALDRELGRVEAWGGRIGATLVRGGRLLAVGNGGSAAHAQHLTSELVGRFRTERPPLSALSLHAEGSSVTAIANDYGPDEMFARQVRAHGRPGDVLVAFSTSGRSPNVLCAVEAARRGGLTVLGLTGPAPNELELACDDAVTVEAESTATVQEIHQVAVHLLCVAVDEHVVAGLR
jgi:D-sedoheptulose 7-phosphate isomerase